MDWYEKDLLARAVEAAHRRGEWIDFFPKGWDKAREGDVFMVGMYRSGPSGSDPEKFMRDAWTGDTLADALSALLSELGEEVVPEPPSAEQIAAWDRENEQLVGGTEGVRSMRQWFAVAPLDCIAWLEGGEA